MLDGKNEKTLKAIRAFDDLVKGAREKLRVEISADNLDQVNEKIKRLKESIDLSPINEGLKVLEEEFKDNVLGLLREIEAKSDEHKVMVEGVKTESNNALSGKSEELLNEIESVKQNLSSYSQDSLKQMGEVGKNISDLKEKMSQFALIDEMSDMAEKNGKGMREMKKVHEEEVAKINNLIKKVRMELVSMIANKGGGSMNRKITMGGVDYLTKYTDINFKPGTNVTFTVANNDTTKMVDFTISATGTGGTVRSISTVSVSSIFGDASGTDYVAICNQGIKITLPTAVGNTNLYTIKNTSNSSVMVATTGGETIDDDANVILATKYTQIDLISDSINWNIT